MKDGSERTCLMSAELLTLNGQTCVLTVLNDITERKQAEVARQVAEERFAKTFRASPQAMCITRVADGRYIDVNKSFARLVDYPYADMIGRTSFDVGIWTDPEIRAATNRQIIEQGGKRIAAVEGSGMGLAVVKKLFESYGGAIQVESSVGHGATFRFTWPKISSLDQDTQW